jgi:hypothetical protein
MQSHADRHAEVVQTLKSYLENQSWVCTEPQFCSDCGSLLFRLKAQCWLDGDENGWNISLPYCPQCHPLELSEKKMAA